MRTCGGTPPYQSNGVEYSYIGVSQWFVDPSAACASGVPYENQQAPGYTVSFVGVVVGSGTDRLCTMSYKNKATGEAQSANRQLAKRGSVTCPVGWYVTPAGCVQTRPVEVVTPEQIEEEMAPKELPPQLPPGFPYPLDPTAPFIFEPDTANPPNAQPLRVPQGNPIPIPNTNPQQYRQPVTRFTPAPTTQDPFRLDSRPEDLITNSPTGMTSPTPVTPGTPDGEKPEQFDLCKEHPDILACQKIDFDTPDGEIPKENRQITYAPENVLGGGSCPAPRDLAYGRQFSYATTCDALTTYVRPMVIAIAGWMAIVIIFSIGKPE